jgi:hypothetical protein
MPRLTRAIGRSGWRDSGRRATTASAVFKQFSIERVGQLEFRAEAFNLTNTPQFGQPGNVSGFLSTGPGNPNQFSTITSLRNNPRLLQLALKLYY